MTQPIEANINSVESVVSVTAAMGSAGQALTATPSSSIRLSRGYTGGPIEYQVGGGAWVLLDRNQGIDLSIDLGVTPVLVRKATTTTAAIRLHLKVNTVVSTAPTPGVPLAAGAPVTISGVPFVGNVLTAAIAAGWQNTGGNWTRNGAAISGATALTYALVNADAPGPVTYKSSNIPYTPPALTISVVPAVTAGPVLSPVTAGGVVTFTAGTFAGTATYNLMRGTTVVAAGITSGQVVAGTLAADQVFVRLVASAPGQPSAQADSNTVVVGAANTLLASGARMVVEGDSIAAFDEAGGHSWQYFMWAQTGAKLYYPTTYQDTSGTTAGIDTGGNQARGSTQISTRGTTTLPTMNSTADTTKVLAQKPDVVILHGGTNDIAHGDLNATALAADIRALIQVYLDGGAKFVVVDTIIPHNTFGDTGWSGAMETCRLAVNTSIRNFPNSDPRIKVADVASAAWDLTSALTTYQTDGVHPNFKGMRLMADIQTPVVNSLFSDAVGVEIAKYTDAANLLVANSTNAMAGTAGTPRPNGTGPAPTGLVATGWLVQNDALGVACACSKDTLADGSAAQRIVLSGTMTTANGYARLYQNFAFPVAIGDNYEMLVAFELAAGSANLRTVGMSFGANGSAGVSLSAGTTYDMAPDGLSGVLRTRCQSPGTSAGTAGGPLRITLQLGTNTSAATAVDVKFGKAIFRKVTAIAPQ